MAVEINDAVVRAFTEGQEHHGVEDDALEVKKRYAHLGATDTEPLYRLECGGKLFANGRRY